MNKRHLIDLLEALDAEEIYFQADGDSREVSVIKEEWVEYDDGFTAEAIVVVLEGTND